MMKSSNKSYFKGLIIGGVGTFVAAKGIALLLEAIEELTKMVAEQGYSAIDAFLNIFGDVFGLILLAIGVFVICEGAKKAGIIADYKKKKIITVKYCAKKKKIK